MSGEKDLWEQMTALQAIPLFLGASWSPCPAGSSNRIRQKLRKPSILSILSLPVTLSEICILGSPPVLRFRDKLTHSFELTGFPSLETITTRKKKVIRHLRSDTNFKGSRLVRWLNQIAICEVLSFASGCYLFLVHKSKSWIKIESKESCEYLVLDRIQNPTINLLRSIRRKLIRSANKPFFTRRNMSFIFSLSYVPRLAFDVEAYFCTEMKDAAESGVHTRASGLRKGWLTHGRTTQRSSHPITVQSEPR